MSDPQSPGSEGWYVAAGTVMPAGHVPLEGWLTAKPTDCVAPGVMPSWENGTAIS